MVADSDALLAQWLPEVMRLPDDGGAAYGFTSLPYGTEWSPGLPGIYVIYAMARDNSNNLVMSQPVVVTSTTGKEPVPTVSLNELDDEYTLNETLDLIATASDADNGSIRRVYFFINGTIEKIDWEPEYHYRFQPPGAGVYDIWVAAEDDFGNSAISNVERIVVKSSLGPTVSPSMGLPWTATGTAGMSLDADTNNTTLPTSRRYRRSSDSTDGNSTVANRTIYGTDSKFDEELRPGMQIRFILNGHPSGVYTVEKVIDSETLLLNADYNFDDDPDLRGAQATIEVVETYRVNSTIPLGVQVEDLDATIASVSYYVDGQLLENVTQWPFTSNKYIPQFAGTKQVTVIAEDSHGSQSVSIQSLEVLEQEGEVPTGRLLVGPTSPGTSPFAVTRGTSLVAEADFVDPDDGMQVVEFYLNGKIIGSDDSYPYHQVFMPETQDTINGNWNLTVVGIDKSGNRLSLTEQGTVQEYSSQIEVNIALPVKGETLFDGEEIEIVVELGGAQASEINLTQIKAGTNLTDTNGTVYLFANGKLIGAVDESGPQSGIYIHDWAVNSFFADATNGEVELVAFASMHPVNGHYGYIASNKVSIVISARNPLIDDKSFLLQSYKDLALYTPTDDEIEANLDGIIGGSDKIYDWVVELTEKEIFQDIVDALAAHYVTIGKWPTFLEVREAMLTYSIIPNNGTDGSPDADGDGYSLNQETKYGTVDTDAASYPRNAFRVLDYIDETFRSDKYLRLHGFLPQLEGQSQTENLELNRRNFVSMLIANKCNGLEATVQQRIQGAYRLQSFDPNSQASQQQQQQTQMSQMAMLGGALGGFGGFGGGGRGNNNNNMNSFWATMFGGPQTNTQTTPTAPKYHSGISPVVFTGYMVTEDKIDNLDLVWGVPSRRDSFYTAALMVALWQNQQPELDQAEIDQLSKLSKGGQIEAILNDYRYRSRFTSVWKNAETPDENIPDWKYLDWFGYFNDKAFPWNYHKEHGWIYVSSMNENNIWYFDSSIGSWLWTSKGVYPYLFDATRNSWLYYQEGSGSSPQRLFYDFGKGSWEYR